MPHIEQLMVRNVRIQGTKTSSWDVYDKCVRIARVTKIGTDIKAILGRIKPDQITAINLTIEEVERGVRRELAPPTVSKGPIVVKSAPKVHICYSTSSHATDKLHKGGLGIAPLHFQMPAQ